MLDTGRHPRMGFEPHSHVKMETANEFAGRMRESLEEAKAALTKAKDDMAHYYNQRRDPTPEYQVGDKVYLDASDIKTTRPSKKLAHRNLGPFPIVRRVGSHAYRLRLPRSLSRLHPVFPVIKLTLAPHDSFNRRNQPPPPPEIVDDEEHYEVEEILDSRFHRNKLQYLVKWKGFGYEENSWTNERDVFAPRLVREFHQNHPAAPRHIRKIHFDSMFSTASRSLRSRRGVM
jgi:chromodomain-containing protein